MKKLTATEFATLKPSQAYSAYDDAINAATEARRAQLESQAVELAAVKKAG